MRQKNNDRFIPNTWLLVAGFLTVAAALAHVAIIIGGPDWYRFFGADEQMAQMAEQGSAYPAIVTAGIAAVLGIWSLYAVSGAGAIPRLPLLKTALILIAAVFLLRGLLGLPVVLFFDSPYFQELGQSLTFMVISSAICLAYGICSAVGTWQLFLQLRQQAGSVGAN